MPIASALHSNVPVQLRGLAFLAFADTGYVLRLSGTVDDGGGGRGSATWGTVGSALPCRVTPMGAQKGMVAAQIDERSTHTIYLPPATTVIESDRFAVGSDTYEITAVKARTDEPIRELEAFKR